MKDIPTQITNYGYIQLLSKAKLYVLVHSQSALTHNVTFPILIFPDNTMQP